MWRSFIYRDDVTNQATKAKPDTQVLYIRSNQNSKYSLLNFNLNYFVFLNLRKTLHNFIFRRWLFENLSTTVTLWLMPPVV